MRVFLDSIGCRLNQSEMESLARQLANQGHQIVQSPAEADLCILNTCAVTQEAERKSRQAARRFRRINPQTDIVLTGCYVTLSPKEMTSVPGVIQIADNAAKSDLASLIAPPPSPPKEPCWQLPGGRTRAFVQIQDGCDNRCTFCVTTIARGPGRSRPEAEIIAEIQALKEAGYREVVLTGVHVGSYAREQSAPQPDPDGLKKLVAAILRETAIPRLRLSSLEPWDIPPDFFELWHNPRLCRQLHLPLQSGSATVLRRMGRHTTPDAFRSLAAQALEAIPDLALTTDIIVGFPGESDDEFQQSITLVRELGFSKLHVFGYSPRPGTAATRLPGRIPSKVIRERSCLMRQLGDEMQRVFFRRFVGRTTTVLWEAPVTDQDGRLLWRGHTDNYILVTTASEQDLHNQITRVQLTGLHPGGMWGEVITGR